LSIQERLEEVKKSLNALYYNSNSIDSVSQNRINLLHAIDGLEIDLLNANQQVINCTAKECIYHKEGKCTAKEISIEDIEQNDNIKFLEEDYMACKTLKHIEH
jgi:hypothetical protein